MAAEMHLPILASHGKVMCWPTFGSEVWMTVSSTKKNPFVNLCAPLLKSSTMIIHTNCRHMLAHQKVG